MSVFVFVFGCMVGFGWIRVCVYACVCVGVCVCGGGGGYMSGCLCLLKHHCSSIIPLTFSQHRLKVLYVQLATVVVSQSFI